jgi:hypothetical protein
MPKQRVKSLSGAIRSLLNQEIKWHCEHRGGSGSSVVQERGFIAGLKQARYVVCRALKDANVKVK